MAYDELFSKFNEGQHKRQKRGLWINEKCKKGLLLLRQNNWNNLRILRKTLKGFEMLKKEQ